MGKLEMNGPYAFAKEVINQKVQSGKIGNYALGYVNEKNVFIVQYVGRSVDMGVQERLKSHIDEGDEYSDFKFSYANNEKEAYEKECRNYHDFGEDKLLDNDIHPAKPKSSWLCPVCGQ